MFNQKRNYKPLDEFIDTVDNYKIEYTMIHVINNIYNNISKIDDQTFARLENVAELACVKIQNTANKEAAFTKYADKMISIFNSQGYNERPKQKRLKCHQLDWLAKTINEAIDWVHNNMSINSEEDQWMLQEVVSRVADLLNSLQTLYSIEYLPTVLSFELLGHTAYLDGVIYELVASDCSIEDSNCHETDTSEREYYNCQAQLYQLRKVLDLMRLKVKKTADRIYNYLSYWNLLNNQRPINAPHA